MAEWKEASDRGSNARNDRRRQDGGLPRVRADESRKADRRDDRQRDNEQKHERERREEDQKVREGPEELPR